MVGLFDVALGRVGRIAALVLMGMALLAGSALAAGGGTAASSGGSGSTSGGSPSGGAGMAGGPHHKSPRSPFGNRTLRSGMRGHQVTLLQFYLDVVGYHTPVDGQFGSRTKRSVSRFQVGYGLRPSGVVTPRVGRALGGKLQEIEAIKPNGRTSIHRNGVASAPSNAPAIVKAVVAAGNRIISKSYCYAGGHGSWKSSCYDCSGSVSYALHGAGLLSSPEDSTQLESYGAPGRGRWVTVYADSSHTFLVVAGRAFDTANFGGPNTPSGSGPRWRFNPRGNLRDGGHYIIRHPPGL